MGDSLKCRSGNLKVKTNALCSDVFDPTGQYATFAVQKLK